MYVVRESLLHALGIIFYFRKSVSVSVRVISYLPSVLYVHLRDSASVSPILPLDLVLF